MGMFSYICTKCGGHDQFDWANSCVLKIDDVYVRGYYDSYGGVKISVEGGDKNKSSVMAYHEQFRQFFDCWDLSNECLLASEIYCDGDGENQDNGTLRAQSMGNMRWAMIRGAMGGGDFSDDEGDGSNRHCAPKGIAVLDALDASMLESLPKAVSPKDKAKKGTPKTKKAKSARF